jgi:hypothetical protein
VLCDRSAYPDGDVTDAAAAAFDPQRPTPARHGVDAGAWEPLIARALSLRPADRFADAGDFLRALDAARGVSPAAPPRPRAGRRVGWLVAALGLSLAAIVGMRARRSPPPASVAPPTPTPIPVEPADLRGPTADVALAPPPVDAGVPMAQRPLAAPPRRLRRAPSPAVAPSPPPVAVPSPPVVAPSSPPQVEIE